MEVNMVSQMENSNKKVIKVCINPQCSEVAHNIKKEETKCRNCDFKMVEINSETYVKKFALSFFQYDYSTGELVNAAQMGYSFQLKIFS